jgi:hypothetical protein
VVVFYAQALIDDYQSVAAIRGWHLIYNPRINPELNQTFKHSDEGS